MRTRSLPANLIFFVVIVVACALYFGELVIKQPSGIHAWAQSDRLALAIGFYDNGMNFFLPSTFNQMTYHGITGVEFPIQSYLAALMGKLIGREYISISFRLLNTLISCIGVFFLFKAVYKRTKDIIFSLVPALFVFSSPIFLYYTCNYLPDTAGASIVFIAFYYMLDYTEHGDSKYAVRAFIFLTLASLIKTSAAIYFLGFAGYTVLQTMMQGRELIKRYWPALLTAVLGFGVLYGYYSYNQYLNNKYQSGVFLASIKPFQDADKLNYFINYQLKVVLLKEYFVQPAYLLLTAIAIPAIGMLFKTTTGKRQLLLLAVFIIGSLSFAYLMGTQLIGHDYYAVVIFLPWLVFLMLISIIAVRQRIGTESLKPARTAILSGTIVMFLFADFQLYQRLSPDYYPFKPGVVWSAGGSKILDSLHIPKSELIGVFDDDPINLALYYFDRKGYTFRPGEWKNDLHFVDTFMRNRQLHTLVMSASKTAMLTKDFPETFAHFQPIATTDSLAIYHLNY